MRKASGVITAVIVLGAAYAGTSWYFGKRIQAEYEGVIALANQRMQELTSPEQTQSTPVLALASYDRGLFTSDAVYTLTTPVAEGKLLELRLQDHISHGPFPMGALKAGKPSPMLAYIASQLVSTPSVQPWFDAVASTGQAPLHAVTYVGFAGNGQSDWTVEPVSLSHEGIDIDFSGGTLTADLSNQYQDTDVKGQFDSVVMVDEREGDTMRIANIGLSSISLTGEDQSISTRNRLDVDSVVVENPDKETVSISNMSMLVEGMQRQAFIDATMAYSFGRAQVGSADLGSMSASAELSRLDLKAFLELGQAYDAIMARQGVTREEDLVLTPDDEAELRQKALALLAPNPMVTVGPIVWKNSSGESEVTLALDMIEPATPDAQSLDALLPQIMKKADLKMAVSRAMLVQVFSQAGSEAEREQLAAMGGMLYDQYVARLQALGFVSIEDGAATLDIVYEDAMFKINGQSMTPEEFVQRALILAF